MIGGAGKRDRHGNSHLSIFDATMQQKREQISASLDLHGKRKEQAISDVTQFLENVIRKKSNNQYQPVWVHIITGTGSHSSQGPVLRSSVESLLRRRGMSFSLENGKGCFLVNANSGHALYAAPQPKDSKVNVRYDQRDPTRLVGRAKPTSFDDDDRNSSARNIFSTGPLPVQVANHDDVVQQIKIASVKEINEKKKERIKSQRHLKKVLKESEKENQKLTSLQQDEEEQLQMVLSLSQTDLCQSDSGNGSKCDEEEALKRVMSESILEQQQRQQQHSVSDDDYEKALEDALQISLRESSISVKSAMGDEDDEELQNVLRNSLRESRSLKTSHGDDVDDEDLEHILKLSCHER